MTGHHGVPRGPSAAEHKILLHYLAGSRRADSSALITQILFITIVAEQVSTLDLLVDTTQTAPVHVDQPGPLQPRMFVIGPGAEIWGEVLVWVTDGFLSGMGLAWWNDDVPMSWDRVETTAYEWDMPA